MQTMKFERCAILPTLAVGLLLGCGGGDGTPDGDPTPTAPTPGAPVTAPAPTIAPSSVVRIVVPVINPETGETVELEVEFDEGAGAGDDPTKVGDRGKTLIRVGGESAVVFPLDEDGKLHPSIGLGAVECNRGYLVSRYIDAPTNVNGCAPPAAMAAQFNRVKDDALATAGPAVHVASDVDTAAPACLTRDVGLPDADHASTVAHHTIGY